MSLRNYLQANGMAEVFEVRRLIRELDYEAFLARYQAKGRTPYHPALMTGLVLFALMRGVRSLREMEKFARENVSAWWLTGGACPDHASIGRFVARFGDLLVGPVFESLTSTILQRTGTSGTDLAGDGTTVQSVACRFNLIREEAARSRAQELRERVEALPEQAKQQRERLLRKAASYERAADAAQREETRTNRNSTLRSVKVAPADPEATHQRLKNGLPAPSYKPSVFANEARIVVAHDVQSSSENRSVDGLCAQAKRVSGEEKLDCVRLDAGYFSGKVLQTLLDHEVDNPLVTDHGLAGELRGRKKLPKRFAKRDFTYDDATDTLTCPAGETLKLVRHRKARQTKIYGGAPCQSCSLKDQCTRSKRGRQVRRYDQDPLLGSMRTVMENPQARADYRRRSAMVEPVFADLQQVQGLTRFLRAGLAKVRVEFGLVVTAHNLLRYLSWRRRKTLRKLLERWAALTAPLALGGRWLERQPAPTAGEGWIAPSA